MKNFVILISAILILSCRVHKAALSADSLKKYSYSILGFETHSNGYVVPVGGTGFFIRKNGKLFLVTAKHVFTGCDTNNDKNMPDVMNILLEDSTGFPHKVIQVNIKTIKDTSACLPIEEDPDVITVQVSDNSDIPLNSVENFLYPPFKKTRDLVMFGFPGKEYIKHKGQFVHANASKMHISKDQYNFFQFVDTANHKADLINSMIVSDKIPLHHSLKGYSGSPVFVQDFKTYKWRICGLFSAYSIDTVTKVKAILSPNIDYIIKEIDKQL